ncbi:Os10g0447500 [Oryza sativa Japonica Group]|uniref:Os10g0447500 protein n=1 Tax=Oryza sativa subsp. japonica TaxID=39947 RepID=C7J7H1_ORYSJ|nr:Os10g0447500 [Oryza sativa Japonica Group]|eukprot:NP_001176181.1 Os10g0447500 [Oryza sativa Japonica Group]
MPENAFVMVQEGTLCLAIVAITEQQPVSILGNLAQQNIHVGHDLDAGTVTFAAADCAGSGRRAAGEEDGADGDRDGESEDVAAVVVHGRRSFVRAVSGVAGGCV